MRIVALSKKLGLDVNGYDTLDFRYSVLQEQDIRWVIEIDANVHIASLDCDRYLYAFEPSVRLDNLHDSALDGGIGLPQSGYHTNFVVHFDDPLVLPAIFS